MAADDSLADFERRDTALDGETRAVYRSGSGPAVIVLSEMPGITPDVARFARWVREAGFTVYLPSLFGRDGAYPEADAGAAVFRKACVSRTFRALGGGGESSPVTRWLMALARLAHEESSGVGVGAVGMCFTGNFALTMMLEPAVIAAVLSQPALPLDDPTALEISPAEIATVRARLDEEDLTVLGLRFAGDPFCPAARFEAYRAELGPHFRERVLPDEAAAGDPPPFYAAHVPEPHCVLTAHLVDEPGHPTIEARDEVIALLRQRLQP